MPGQFLTRKERERLSQFPASIPQEDLITFFTLTPSDLNHLPIKSADYNRLGFALQLCALRYMGFCPDDLNAAPPEAVLYTANQLGVDPKVLAAYGQRNHTRTDHLIKIGQYLGFRKASETDLSTLSEWLTQRALEHAGPTLLLQMAADWLYSQKRVRPGVTVLERMVVVAREQAQEETYRQLNTLLTDERKGVLDQLLITDEASGRTPLFWLRRGAVANTPEAILETLEKLKFLRAMGVDEWDLHSLNPNRQKFLAQIGRRSTNQALQRMSELKRDPILLAFLRQSLYDIIDEVIDLLYRCLSDTYARARRDHKEFRLALAKTTNEKLILFFEMGQIVLDATVSDSQLRSTIYSKIPQEELRAAIEECDGMIRPKDDQSIDYFANRYGYLRKFAPQFLNTLQFHSHQVEDPLIEALEYLKTLNATGKRKVKEDAPLEFIAKSWLPYVLDKEDQIVRRYYELSALWELRNALRSGDIWVNNSRRYANPETYLIPKDLWPTLRSEACRLLGLPQNPEERLSQRNPQLEQVLSQLDRQLAVAGNVRIEQEQLVFSPLEAEALPLSSMALQDMITHRLPRVDLTDLLIEVDGWTRFTDHFEHAGGSQPRTTALLTHLYASILAQACNFGMKKMAEISALTYDQLAWCTNWYIREETLGAAINTLVNFQYNQPLSHLWGGGTMSSSDGQRFPVPVKARNATANPRYFGYGRGLTFMSWTSDQFSQYGSRVVPTTVRDATYVLDGILDNETELNILEHTTDTAGYTELVFALFDLLGIRNPLASATLVISTFTESTRHTDTSIWTPSSRARFTPIGLFPDGMTCCESPLRLNSVG